MSRATTTRLLLLIALSWTAGVEATTRTVSDASRLQAAVDASGSGDEVVIQGGTYRLPVREVPTLVIPASASGMTLRVEPGATVLLYATLEFRDHAHDITIDGSAGTLIFDGEQIGYGVICPICSNLRLEAFEIRHHYQGVVGEYANSTFTRLNIHHFGIDDGGGQTRTCACNTGQDLCESWHPGKAPSGHCHGFYIQGDSHDNIFDGNHLHHGEGFGYHNYGSNHTMKNSVIHDTHRGGIAIIGGGAQRIFNNTIARTPGDGIIWGYGGQEIVNNIVVDTQGCGICVNAASAQESNNLISGNPSFVDAAGGDFHLASGSPAIDAGAMLAEVTTDADRAPRPQLSGMDLGAYEYGSGGPIKPPGKKLPPPRNFRIAGKP